MNLVFLISIWCFLVFIKARSPMAATSFTTDGTTTATSNTEEQPMITTISTAETIDSNRGTMEATPTESSTTSALLPPVSISATTSHTLFPMTTSTSSFSSETTSETTTTPNNDVTNTTSTIAPTRSTSVDTDITTDVTTTYIQSTCIRFTTAPSATTTGSTTEANHSREVPITTTTDANSPSTVTMTDSGITTTSTLFSGTTMETTEETPMTTNVIRDKTPKFWTSGESDLLFALRLEKDELFKKSKIHAQIWNSIAAKMEKQGYIMSGGQCSNKWKSLKISYMETVDHNSKTGEYPKTCKYFGEMNQLFGNKPSTQPTFNLH